MQQQTHRTPPRMESRTKETYTNPSQKGQHAQVTSTVRTSWLRTIFPLRRSGAQRRQAAAASLRAPLRRQTHPPEVSTSVPLRNPVIEPLMESPPKKTQAIRREDANRNTPTVGLEPTTIRLRA